MYEKKLKYKEEFFPEYDLRAQLCFINQFHPEITVICIQPSSDKWNEYLIR
jgi:hypothetical protein